MRHPLDLTGRVAVVTGGGRGIAARLLETGAEVVICGRKEPESLPAAAGCSVLFVPADVRQAEAIDRVIEETRPRYGRFDPAEV